MKSFTRQWDLDSISNIINSMIVEDEQELRLEPICNWGLKAGHMRHDFSFHELQLGNRRLRVLMLILPYTLIL